MSRVTRRQWNFRLGSGFPRLYVPFHFSLITQDIVNLHHPLFRLSSGNSVDFFPNLKMNKSFKNFFSRSIIFTAICRQDLQRTHLIECCRGGGIGRHAVLRGQWGNPWEFESPPRHQFSIRRRSQVVKAGVCKTPIRRFESARRLQYLQLDWRIFSRM